jgi:hypothetical protein
MCDALVLTDKSLLELLVTSDPLIKGMNQGDVSTPLSLERDDPERCP